jgi:hypothetical protein
VNNGIHTVESFAEGVFVADIAFDQFEIAAGCARQKALAAEFQVIKNAYFMATLKEHGNHCTAHIASATGDKNPHSSVPSMVADRASPASLEIPQEAVRETKMDELYDD